jgi:hypothetical protein
MRLPDRCFNNAAENRRGNQDRNEAVDEHCDETIKDE